MFVGVIAGNFFGFHTAPWIDFLAMFGSGLLPLLAGADIDPATNGMDTQWEQRVANLLKNPERQWIEAEVSVQAKALTPQWTGAQPFADQPRGRKSPAG